MIKKILFNSQRRTSSTYMSTLIRNMLPTKGSLYFEKIDLESTNSSKINLWKTSHENQIQVAVVRNPYDIAVSDLVLTLTNAQKYAEKAVAEGTTPLNENVLGTQLLTNDLYFIRMAGLVLKKTERYLDAIISGTDDSHLSYRFEDTTDPIKRKLVVKDILAKAGYEDWDDNAYDEADDYADIHTSFAVNHIVVNPVNRTENYDLVKNKFTELSDAISLDIVNAKYQLALEKCISI